MVPMVTITPGGRLPELTIPAVSKPAIAAASRPVVIPTNRPFSLFLLPRVAILRSRRLR
jgi:hypothetical protein